MAVKRTNGGALERAASTTSKKKRSYVDPVIADLALSTQFQRVGGNLSPSQVSAIIMAADSGRPSRLVDLFHECRQKSGHVQSIFQTRELAVSGLEFDIAPPEGKKKRDGKYRDQCLDALKRCDTFREMCAHLIGEGNSFGYAYSEDIWKKSDKGSTKGLLVPERFKQINCRRFGFRQVDGALLFDPSDNGAGNNVDAFGEDLLGDYPVGKFVGFTPRVNGDVIAREGLCRIILWMELFRTWDIRDWLQLAELAWKPWRLGQYQKGASKQDKANLRKILQALTTNGVATHPETVKVNLEWPQQASGGKVSAHSELASFLADEESKAVLGQTDMVSPGANGSRAATQARNELRKDRRDADAAALAIAVQRYVVEPFYALNYGPSVEPGQFLFLTEDPLDFLKFSQAIQALRNAGLKIPASYVYDKTGIPEGDEDDEYLGEGAGDKNPGVEPDPNDDEGNDGGAEGEDGSGEPAPAKPKPKPKKARGRHAPQPSP
jgi:phage gp29-like protein